MVAGITALYTGLNALIALVLSALVVRQRHIARVYFGTGGHPGLERAVRAHGNFLEYAPLILLLLLVLEIDKTRPLVLHALGITLTGGRLLHAWGLSRSEGASVGRTVGITLTWITMLVALGVAIRQGIGAVAIQLSAG